MNIITHQRAISLFPRMTFIYKKYIHNGQKNYVTNGDIYIWPLLRGLGWYEPLREQFPDAKELQGGRQMGDDHCWAIQFEILKDQHVLGGELVLRSTHSSDYIILTFVYSLGEGPLLQVNGII